MSWTVIVFSVDFETVDFNTILRSREENIPVVQGITLSSVSTNEPLAPYSSVQSTMTVSSQLSRQGDIRFICTGHNDFLEPFFERANTSSYKNHFCKFGNLNRQGNS